MRFFNTAGPVDPADHYTISPLARLTDDDLLGLISQKKYFILHAPRQTGKTSALPGLMRELNASGEYAAVYLNVEGAQGFREQIEPALQGILWELGRRIELYLGDRQLTETVLRQIRAGYTKRPAGFPQSIVLCGVRDIKN